MVADVGMCKTGAGAKAGAAVVNDERPTPCGPATIVADSPLLGLFGGTILAFLRFQPQIPPIRLHIEE